MFWSRCNRLNFCSDKYSNIFYPPYLISFPIIFDDFRSSRRIFDKKGKKPWSWIEFRQFLKQFARNKREQERYFFCCDAGMKLVGKNFSHRSRLVINKKNNFDKLTAIDVFIYSRMREKIDHSAILKGLTCTRQL